MARKDEKGKPTGNGHNRVQGFVFGISLEGSESVVTEGIKAFANAMAKGGIVLAPLSAPAAKSALHASNSGSTATPGSTEPKDAPENDVEGEDEEENLSTADQSTIEGETERPKRRAAPRAPKFLNELNLISASVQLADFVREKAPSADMDKYAVIAVWFKQHFNTEEICIDHIFTAYKSLGWQAQLPPDPAKTFRNLKSNKNWMDSGQQRGYYKINWNGEHAVNKMGATAE